MLSRLRVPLSWTELLKRTARETIADDVFSLAAQQAYYYFFALFPAILAIISFASFFPIHNLVDGIVDALRGFAPQDVIDIVVDQIRQISGRNLGGILTIAFLITLWSSSNAVMAMCTTLNAAYDITESRPWWLVRLTAVGLTIGLAFFTLISMTLVLAGPMLAEWLAARLGYGAAFEWSWKILQWPIIFVLISTAIAMVYYFAPDAEQDWVWITPGSVLAAALWIASSLGFRFYLTNFGDYNETYGAIGGVMVLLLWFYVSGIALLVGAELNSEIEHASPYGKEVGEKRPGEKKKIGAAAAREYEARQANGLEPRPFPDDVNCDLDRPAPKRPAGRPSDVLIGAAALLPVALKIGRDVRNKLENNDRAG
jgi:membrane protein